MKYVLYLIGLFLYLIRFEVWGVRCEPPSYLKLQTPHLKYKMYAKYQ